MLVDSGRPSAQKVAVQILAESLQTPVSTEVPEKRPGRFVTVQRVGGGMQNAVTDRIQMAIQGWDSTQLAAEQLCLDCEAALSAMVCTPFNGVMIRHFREVTAPLNFPDESGQPRYQALVEFDLVVH